MKPLKGFEEWGIMVLAAGNADSVAAAGSSGIDVR